MVCMEGASNGEGMHVMSIDQAAIFAKAAAAPRSFPTSVPHACPNPLFHLLRMHPQAPWAPRSCTWGQGVWWST